MDKIVTNNVYLDKNNIQLSVGDLIKTQIISDYALTRVTTIVGKITSLITDKFGYQIAIFKHQGRFYSRHPNNVVRLTNKEAFIIILESESI